MKYHESDFVLQLVFAALLVAVFVVARRSHHRKGPGLETFRYPLILLWCVLGGALLLAWLGFKMFAVIRVPMQTAPLWWMGVLVYLMPWYVWLCTGMCAWGAVFLALHRIEIGPATITAHGIRSIESIDPRNVRRFVEYRYRGLALYGDSRKPLLRISWLIQDYRDLFDLIRGLMPAEVEYEVRGHFGQRVD
jgi:hypothetical protein